MDWFKVYSKGILRGSLSQSKDIVQLTWIKLLALENETKFRNGRLEYGPGKPYSLDYIAMNCGIEKELLEGILEEYKEDVNPEDGSPRITVDMDGTIILNNWEKYQVSRERKEDQKQFSIKKSEQQRLRYLANKYPGITVEVIERDFGYVVIDKKTGQELEQIPYDTKERLS